MIAIPLARPLATWRGRAAVIVVASALTVFVIMRTGWVADDAAITYRCVLNMLAGWGPNFNIDERVDAFTHPLWFLSLAMLTLVVRNVFLAGHLLSAGCSLAAIAIMSGLVARKWWQGLLGAALLLASRAWVDFSDSGLENPLVTLLLVCFAAAAPALFEGPATADQGPRLRRILVIVGMMYLTRPDLVLVAVPFLVRLLARFYRVPRILTRSILIASLPVLAWTGFSLFYFGSPVPNTAFAKLGTGVPTHEFILQGVRYLLHSAEHDPVALLTILMALAFCRERDQVEAALTEGYILALAYVVMIGGDFMSGRFIVTPFVVAVIVLVRRPLSPFALVPLGALLFAFEGWYLGPNLLMGQNLPEAKVGPDGIVDERAYYYQHTGLLVTGPFGPQQHAEQASNWRGGQDGIEIMCGGMGLHSIATGPKMHVIDACALADPLLARLPTIPSTSWRIGHFFRAIPNNYVESIQTDRNDLDEPELHRYYDVIRLISRGPLRSWERLLTIVRFNLGLEPLPSRQAVEQASKCAPSDVKQVTLTDLSQTPVDSVNLIDPRATRFRCAVAIALPEPTTISGLDLSIPAGGSYQILAAGEDGAQQVIATVSGHGAPFVLHRAYVSLSNPFQKASSLIITQAAGFPLSSVGHLIINPQ